MFRGKAPLTESAILPFDAVRRVETPEGVTLTLRVAGPLPRLYAALVDGAIRGFAYSLAAFVLSLLRHLGEGPLLLVLFLGEWAYPVLFEVFHRGVTPGKGVLRLKVVNGDGTPVNLTASTLRNLLRFADFLPFGYAAGVLSILLTDDFQRLGDLVAGTVVIHAGNPRPRDPLGLRVPDVPPVAPPVPLQAHEQRVIVGFAERVETWPPDRVRELGDLARRLTGAGGQEGVNRLLGYASWLVGRRRKAGEGES
jgi:uncharacterized RDD family membrane protein YckC